MTRLPRRGRFAAALIAFATALATFAAQAGPAHAATSGRIAIGDSVMLGAKWVLEKQGFDIVDARTSRQASTGPGLLSKRGASLPGNVVVHLGTNGTYSLDTCKDLVRTAGPERRVFLVTVHAKRSWVKDNNEMLRNCAAAFPTGRVTVVDWDWAASRHPQWLYSDGIHLRPEGAKAFARLIASAIDGVT